MTIAETFSKGLSYSDFLDRFASPADRVRWDAMHQRVQLSSERRSLLAGFRREMRVACLAGAWCGDCVNQCPILQRFAAATPKIVLRFFDRDAFPELAAELRVCGGARVPVVVFVSEDGHEAARYGDRTLAKYRQLAADLAGPACPTGLPAGGDALLEAVIGEWLVEFERVQLMLRISPRLRQLHGD